MMHAKPDSNVTGLPVGRPFTAGRAEIAILAALVLGGVLVRLALWKPLGSVSLEGTEYIRLAQELSGTPFDHTDRPYGYPILILIAHLFTSDWVAAARGVSLLAGIAAIPLAWALARRLVRNGLLRLVAPAALAFLPIAVRYSLVTAGESTFMVALLATLLLLVSGRTTAAGIAAGASFLVRPEGLAAALLLAVPLLVRARPRGVRFAAAAGGAALAAAALQGLHGGSWWPSDGAIVAGGFRWWSPSIDAMPAGAGYGGDLAGLLGQLARHGGFVAPLVALAGLASGGWFLAAAAAPILLEPLAGLAHPRLMVPYLPVLWLMAMLVADRKQGALRWTVAGVVVAGLALSGVLDARTYRMSEDGAYAELREAGEWLAPHAGPRSVVYADRPESAFFAGAAYRSLPGGDYESALDAIVARGGDFLVVHHGAANAAGHALVPLVDDKPVVWHETRVQPVFVQDRYLDGRVVMYRVVRPGGPPPLPGEETMKTAVGPIPHSKDHFFHGILAMRAQRWSAAAGEFEYALRLDPENAEALNYRAWCLLQDGRFLDLAESAARQATDLEPENPDYLATLVGVLRAMGGRERAVEYWERKLQELRARRAGAAAGGGP